MEPKAHCSISQYSSQTGWKAALAAPAHHVALPAPPDLVNLQLVTLWRLLLLSRVLHQLQCAAGSRKSRIVSKASVQTLI